MRHNPEPMQRTRDEYAEAIVDSATLARLLEEVRNGTEFQPHSYNRMHNRHNR
jgi:hypothetical protein